MAMFPYFGEASPEPFQKGSIKWFMPPVWVTLSHRQTATHEPSTVFNSTGFRETYSPDEYMYLVSKLFINQNTSVFSSNRKSLPFSDDPC